MSSGNQFERLFKLFAAVSKLVVDGKRSATKVTDLLQSIVDEVQPIFTLYLAPGQENGGWMKGFDLEKHLEETKLIERAFSLDDELVKGWLENPSAYPEEFKGKAIFLWKSKRASGGFTDVAYLCWVGGRVVVYWYWLGRVWGGSSPALLASS